MKKETMKNVAGIILFYILLVLCVVIVDARMEVINEVNGTVSLGN